ncbi:MAG: hypothetical protein AB4426_16680 [Xenococcaceae cyanobacterium]
MIFPLNYTNFSCQRIAKNNVICERKERIIYGIINYSTLKFSLERVEIKEEEKYICLDNEGDPHYTYNINNCRGYMSNPIQTIYIYKTYLKGDNHSFFMKKEASEAYLQSARDTWNLVKQRQQTIEDFINGLGEPFYEYEKPDNLSWTIIIIIGMALLSIWYV